MRIRGLWHDQVVLTDWCSCLRIFHCLNHVCIRALVRQAHRMSLRKTTVSLMRRPTTVLCIVLSVQSHDLPVKVQGRHLVKVRSTPQPLQVQGPWLSLRPLHPLATVTSCGRTERWTLLWNKRIFDFDTSLCRLQHYLYCCETSRNDRAFWNNAASCATSVAPLAGVEIFESNWL